MFRKHPARGVYESGPQLLTKVRVADPEKGFDTETRNVGRRAMTPRSRQHGGSSIFAERNARGS